MIIKTHDSCRCRGCGQLIPKYTQVIMTNSGPYHLECTPEVDDALSTSLDLESGGKLLVSDSGRGISYTFPGPDRRYRSTHFFLPEEKLKETAEAIRVNWKEYERIRANFPLGETAVKIGQSGMTIRVSLVNPGVWILPYHIGACNAEQADRIANEYESAIQALKNLASLIK